MKYDITHNPFYRLSQKMICWSLGALLLLLAFAVIAPEFSFEASVAHAATTEANTASSSEPLAAVLCNVITMIQGNTGKALATIALIFLAIGLFIGKINWPVAMAVGIGIGGLFGAQSIVNAISGGSGTTFCAAS